MDVCEAKAPESCDGRLWHRRPSPRCETQCDKLVVTADYFLENLLRTVVPVRTDIERLLRGKRMDGPAAEFLYVSAPDFEERL